MSELTITTSQVQAAVPVTVLHVRGHLHGNTEAELLEQARMAHTGGVRYLVLDLTGVEILTGAGLRAIQMIFNLLTPPGDVEMIHQRGREPYKSPYLKLVCPDPNVYFVLSIAGFLQNITIYNELEAAIKSFSQ